MKLTNRLYRDETDYDGIRSFLREVFLLNNRLEISWQAYRFDYCRWHIFANMGLHKLEEVVGLWETKDGKIVGVVNPEGKRDLFLHAHPDYQTPELEAEMIDFAEDLVEARREDGRSRLQIWAHEDDAVRRKILINRGYKKGEEPEFQRRRAVSGSIEQPAVPPGFTVRALTSKDELPARSMASWKAFHPEAPESEYEGWEWYLNIQRAPLYRRELDIVAEGPNGEIASFCTVWFDAVTRTGAFEPVGTAPEHQKRGLGKAVMTEGLIRLNRLGAAMATVSSYTPPAHALYASVGFQEYSLLEPWRSSD